jgi:endosialidase-like protein
LFENTIGFQNTATGAAALFSNTKGIDNTATGTAALHENTTGRFNTATGFQALPQNTTGSANTADGLDSLFNNTTGHHNTAIGMNAMHQNTTGSSNIALGDGAGAFLTTGSDNIDIGNDGRPGESSTIRIGDTQTQFDTYIAGIFGTNIVGSPVAITSDGHLGIGPASSARFKDEIKPMDNASEIILALKPVTFRYKKEIDPHRGAQFGLVAEEVAKVNPALVVRDAKGEIYTVRYDAVNAMLLNEFLKEHRKVEAQEATIAKLQQQVDALTAGLQKVSAQLEVSKSTPQTVDNNE